MWGEIIMSQRELQRHAVMGLVLSETMTLIEGAQKMGLSYRQAKRIKKSFKLKGVKGIIHGNRGRWGHNRIGEEERRRVLDLAATKYRDFNDTHCAEKINEIEGIKVSRETIRVIRRASGIPPKRKRRAPKYRSRREPKANFGHMVQLDGSPHKWFGENNPPCSLMAAIDDSTGKILAAHFEKSECSFGYLKVLYDIIKKHGIPLSIYHDRHNIFVRTDNHMSLKEQLDGKREPTQIGLVAQNLGITSIPAYSPQAKGRIERAFQTLQDRLIAELKLSNINYIDDANKWIKSYLPKYNARFGRKPKDGCSLFRKPYKIDLKKILSFSYEATVGNDNVVRIGGLNIPIPKPNNNRSYSKCKVDVKQLLDSSWRVYYKNNLIAKYKKTHIVEPVRTRIINKNIAKGAKEYLYVYLAA